MSGTPPWAYPDIDFEPTHTAPDRVDVAVIGGGLTGLAAARAISATGGEVVVFEKDRIGGGATRHGLGVLEAHYPGGPSTIMRRVGRGKATGLWIAAASAANDIDSIVDTKPVQIVTKASRRRPASHLQRDARWLTERGLTARFRHDSQSLETSGAVVDPLDLALALGDCVEKEGGTLAQGVTVTSLSRNTGGYQVLSTAGKTTAGVVVVAAGARRERSGVHSPGPVVRAADRYGALLRTSGSVDADVLRVGALTVRRLSSSSLLVAAHRGMAPGLDPARAALRLVDTLRHPLPAVGRARIVHSWTTPIGLTADGVPHVWRTDGIWFTGGFNGDAPVVSVALGTELGHVLAGLRAQTIFAGVTPPRRRRRLGRLEAVMERLRDR
jgi:glycine/D-amino acid oxidase-like deaminating enzyme